jgi:hypothetical protein
VQGKIVYVGYEVLTVVVMDSTVLWDITPCSPLKVTCFHGGVLLGVFDPQDADMFL